MGCGCLVVILLLGYILFQGGSCKHDSNYIPYLLKGYDAYVYNNDTDKEYYTGRIDANYLTQKKGLSRCQSLAYEEAKRRHLSSWSYVCCTITYASDCATKVR